MLDKKTKLRVYLSCSRSQRKSARTNPGVSQLQWSSTVSWGLRGPSSKGPTTPRRSHYHCLAPSAPGRNNSAVSNKGGWNSCWIIRSVCSHLPGSLGWGACPPFLSHVAGCGLLSAFLSLTLMWVSFFSSGFPPICGDFFWVDVFGSVIGSLAAVCGILGFLLFILVPADPPDLHLELLSIRVRVYVLYYKMKFGMFLFTPGVGKATVWCTSHTWWPEHMVWQHLKLHKETVTWSQSSSTLFSYL